MSGFSYNLLSSFMNLQISINTEPIGVSMLGKLHIGPWLDLGYLFLDLGLMMFFLLFVYPSNKAPLDARDAAAI